MHLFKNLNRTLVLWLCRSDGWERDYIFEIFPFPHFMHLGNNEWKRLQENVTLSTEALGLSRTQIAPRVVVYNIENSGMDGKYSMLYNVLANDSRVAVLVHISDEWGGSPRKWKYGEGTDAYPLVPLVLRQYSVAPYRSFHGKHQSNVMQIPLGYMKNMLTYTDHQRMTSLEAANLSLSIDANARNLSWSFVGTLAGHRERAQMIEVFAPWMPHEIWTGLSSTEMRCDHNTSFDSYTPIMTYIYLHSYTFMTRLPLY